MAKITINEDYLVGQMNLFTRYEDESSQRLLPFNWGDGTADGTGPTPGNLAAEKPMKVGGPTFTPGLNLATAAENVRKNFLARMTAFHEQSGFLHSGLQSLLDNSERIESLNTVTADDFDYYVEQSASVAGSSAPASGSGPGSTSGSGPVAGSASGAA